MNKHWLKHKDDPVWREKKRKEMRERAAAKYRETRPHLQGKPVKRGTAWLCPNRKQRVRIGKTKLQVKLDAIAHRKAFRKAWHNFMLIHCKLCSRPFIRKELPISRRCKPCVRAMYLKRKLADPIRHRELKKAAKHRRRAAKTGAGGHCSAKQWRTIVARFNGCCALCGASGEMTRDHIIPISRGGNDDPLNIQPLCHPCNTLKGDKVPLPLQAFIPGIKSAV